MSKARVIDLFAAIVIVMVTLSVFGYGSGDWLHGARISMNLGSLATVAGSGIRLWSLVRVRPADRVDRTGGGQDVRSA